MSLLAQVTEDIVIIGTVHFWFLGLWGEICPSFTYKNLVEKSCNFPFIYPFIYVFILMTGINRIITPRNTLHPFSYPRVIQNCMPKRLFLKIIDIIFSVS